jgi:hypothetical protein
MLLQASGYQNTYKFSLSINKAVTAQQYKNVVNQHAMDPISSVKTIASNKKIINYFVKRTRDLGITRKFNSEVRNLCDKDIIIFPIDLKYIDVSQNLKSGHSVLLIVNRNLKKGYLIDPTNTGLPPDDPRVNPRYTYDYYDVIAYKAQKLIKRILKVDYDIEFVDMVCPQFIENRGTCITWTMFLAVVLVHEYERTNSKKLHPYKVINKILKKYNTKEKLQEVIGKFQYNLNKNIKIMNLIERKVAPEDVLRYLTVGL